MTVCAIRRLLVILLLVGTPAEADPVWRVGNGGHELYLGGSIHLLRQQDYPLPAAFDEAFARAGRLIFETDIAATRSPAFQQTMDRALRLPEGERLGDRLKPETRQLLEARLKLFGLGLEPFDGYRPALLSLSLTMLELQRLGIDAPGVDEILFQRAQRDGKTMGWLETPQQQIAFLSRMGEGEEDLLIRQTLLELTTLEQDFERMIEAWRIGDLDALEALFVTPTKTLSPRLYRELMVERNRQWLPRIVEWLKTPEVELIVVGSAHLAGDEGLVRALRRKGYRVERVDSPAQ